MDWTKITDNPEVKKLLEQREEIENKITEIDDNALIMYELERLSAPKSTKHKKNGITTHE